MKVKKMHRGMTIISILILLAFIFCGCDPADPDGSWDATPKVLEPKLDQTAVFGNNLVGLDASSADQGYFMLAYSGTSQKVRLQVTDEAGQVYTYALTAEKGFQAFPFSAGDGRYIICVYENIQGDEYAEVYSTDITVTLTDEFLPFLYANQYVNFNADSKAVALGEKLARSANEDLDVVQNIYDYIVDHITYDYDLAANVSTGYLPDVDTTLKEEKGICFDYAALAATMLRSQGIPTKLVIGYADEDYHAWISVYAEGVGWVNNIISFKGTDWVRMDPTFDANGSKVSQYIGNGSDYHPMFYY